jgi:hypothetical protein
MAKGMPRAGRAEKSAERDLKICENRAIFVFAGL